MKRITEIKFTPLGFFSGNELGDTVERRKIIDLLKGFQEAPTDTKLRKTLSELQTLLADVISGDGQTEAPVNPLESGKPDDFIESLRVVSPDAPYYTAKLYWYLARLVFLLETVPILDFKESMGGLLEGYDIQPDRSEQYDFLKDLAGAQDNSTDILLKLGSFFFQHENDCDGQMAVIGLKIISEAARKIDSRGVFGFRAESMSLTNFLCGKISDFAPYLDPISALDALVCLASLKHCDQDTVSALAKRIEQKPNSLKASRISYFFWACALLGYRPKRVEEMIGKFQTKMETVNMKHLALFLWSSAVLGFGDHDSIEPIITNADQIMRNAPEHAINHFTIVQLYHFHLATGKFPFADELLQRRKNDGIVHGTPYNSGGRSEREVLAILREILPHIWNISASNREYEFEMDIVLDRQTSEGEKIMFDIEVDGLSHVGRELIDGFRDRILKNMGFKDVIRIDVRRSSDEDDGFWANVRSQVVQKLTQAGILPGND